MKIDPYNHEKRYKVWKAQALKHGIPDISKQNSDIILQYVSDMEHGLNVSLKSVKGSRSLKLIYFFQNLPNNSFNGFPFSIN